MSWLGSYLRGDILLITRSVDVARRTYTDSYALSHISESQARSMGYIRAYKMSDKMKWSLFKQYVRLVPDSPPGFPESVGMDGKTHTIYETSSTLFDYWNSKAMAKFIKGVASGKTLAPIDLKKLLMAAAIGAVALIGFVLLFWKG